MRNYVSVLALSALLAGGAVFTACDREGPGERAGEAVDGNESGVKDKLGPDEKGEETGKKIDRALGAD